jgi:hypothetical protein
MSVYSRPERWRARSLRTPETIGTLEILLFMRAQLLCGASIEAFIKRPDICALRTFIGGMLFVRRSHHLGDSDYGEFFDWLRDVKGECPQYATGGSWDRKCLEECGGDHRAAILRYLNLVAEFVELKEQAARQGSKEEQP